jgi:hypothetical protein
MPTDGGRASFARYPTLSISQRRGRLGGLGRQERVKLRVQIAACALLSTLNDKLQDF